MDTTSGMQSGSPEGTETAVSNSFTDAATTTAVMLSGRPLEPEGTETASSSSSSGLIGGLVGGITVAALLIAGVGIFLAVLMLVHKKRKETYSLNMARNFENKVYESKVMKDWFSTNISIKPGALSGVRGSGSPPFGEFLVLF